MFRKSALAMAMLGAFASTNVVALGLGEIELKSALNQPLNAEVELLSATGQELEELKVAIASSQAFASAGIERTLFLNKLQFSVGHNAAGKPVVRITSRDLVREPFLDFLLEMSWSKGRLVREYTVLVDPPVTMPGAPAVAQAPASRQVSAPRGTAVSAAPGGRVNHTAEMPPVSVNPGEYGPTRRNDTLWSIAESVRPDSGVSVEQTMLGLLRANPEAFIDNNINNLKEGYVLRIPSREELTSVSHSAAVREARAQYAAWRAARGQEPLTAEAGSTESAAAAPVPGTPVAGSEPSLQLIAADASDAAIGGPGSEGLQTMQKELMMANEALEEQRRQGEEMSTRLSTLEEQIANMQRLIQLKDNELARLQAQSAGAPSEPVQGESAAAETTPSEASAEASPAAKVPAEGAVADASTEADTASAQGEPAGGAEVPPLATTEPPPGDAVGAADGGEAAETTADATPEGTGDVTASAPAGADAGTGGEPAAADTAVEAQPEPAAVPAAEVPAKPVTATTPGFVDHLLGNPLWLGAGAAVLALLGFFGLRRKRSVESEFQESILQAAHAESTESDSEIAASQPESTVSKTTESSLLSEFAVSDMGSIRNDGEADPLAEADVYLAYGRYQQAEDLIKDALEKNNEREDLNLKLLEVFMATKNQVAFDEHAQDLLARLENSNHPMWGKVAEMGRELNPGNPLYQAGAAAPAAGEGPESGDGLVEDMDFNMDVFAADGEQSGEPAKEAKADNQGLDFDIDLSFDPTADVDHPDSAGFVPSEANGESVEPQLAGDMDSVESDAVAQDNALEFDLDDFDVETATAAEDEPQGDGELADLDEVSTKLDLARAYIDMGDPDGARSILGEVMEEGSDHQKDEARGIMAQMS
jgi:pilus assembly protein FimV